MSKEELLKIAKPILFNTEMVKAILEGRKTVTRRLIKPQPDARHNCFLGFVTDEIPDHKRKGQAGFGIDEYGGSVQYAKPPCKVGDILYVRETWNICNMDIQENHITFIYRADISEEQSARTVTVSDEIFDKYSESMTETNPEWRPSIHMPKEAARIFLKVKDVRVERLQEIDDKGAYMEGAGEPNTIYQLGARVCEFVKIWQSTIKKEDIDTYGWDASPYVWVIEFEKIDLNKERD